MEELTFHRTIECDELKEELQLQVESYVKFVGFKMTKDIFVEVKFAAICV